MKVEDEKSFRRGKESQKEKKKDLKLQLLMRILINCEIFIQVTTLDLIG